MIDRKELQEQMELVYGEMPPGSIPWNLSGPPALMVAAVEIGKIRPCKTVDLGCGGDSCAIWLAR